MSASKSHDPARNGNSGGDDSAASRTRTRVSRACTRCRQRKDRCDGGTPSCLNCLNADQPCSYDTATKKRGLPEGYVRAVEKLWAVTFTRVPGLEDALLQMLQQDRDLLANIWNHREIGEELHTRWKDSRMFQELETFLASVDHSAAAGSKRKRERDEEDELDPSLGLNTILPPLRALHDIPKIRDGAAQPNPSLGPVPLLATRRIQLPAAASEALGHYFKITHCWFPILDRPQILRQCYELSRSATEISESNEPLAVLTAVLAYTCRQSSVSKQVVMLPGVDSDEMSKVSRQCIPSIHGFFTLSHLQALLILALADITIGSWESAWRIVGLAARILLDNSDVASGRTRDFLATQQGCLILDTLISAKLNRQPQFRHYHHPTRAYLRPDGHEEWEPWPGSVEPAFVISCFNSLTKLSAFLNVFVCEQEVSTDHFGPNRVDELLANLDALALDYPPASQLSSSQDGPPHQTWLKIMHLLVSSCVAASQPNTIDLAVTYLGSVNTIMKDYERRSAPEASRMPAWFLGPAHAALMQLKSFVESKRYAPPPKHMSVLKTLVQQMSNVFWPASEQLAHIVDRITQGKEATTTSTAHQWRASHTLPTNATHEQPRRQTFFPVDPFAQTGITQVRNGSGAVPGVALNGPNQGQTPGNFVQADWSSAIDIPTGTSSLQDGSLATTTPQGSSSMNPMGMYNPSIATSPSFQGDEIDALFHEMAQLDTTEWTSGRNQGLKDFGFDDLTFEQFCNDPDRLFSTNFVDPRQQAVDQRQTADFSMPDLLPQTQNFGYDMSHNVWNG